MGWIGRAWAAQWLVVGDVELSLLGANRRRLSGSNVCLCKSANHRARDSHARFEQTTTWDKKKKIANYLWSAVISVLNLSYSHAFLVDADYAH